MFLRTPIKAKNTSPIHREATAIGPVGGPLILDDALPRSPSSIPPIGV